MTSYLFAWLLFLGLALGSLANLMMHNLTGGRWGVELRPAFVAAARLTPLAALLGLPVLLRMSTLYPIDSNEWFSAEFFAGRAAFYLLLWSALALGITRRRSQGLSAVGLIVYAFTMSLAAVDWIGSLMPHWYSTGFGLVVTFGQMLGSMALAIAYRGLAGPEPAPERSVFIDLGNLLLMYVLTWAYLAFMQFLIIWSGNLPREISWYVPRLQTGWLALAVILVTFHFSVPIAVLLSRAAKGAPRFLGTLAGGVLAAHTVAVYWLIAPSVRPSGFEIAWTDPAALAAFAALWWTMWRPADA